MNTLPPMNTLLLPLEGHCPHGLDGGFSVLPFLGSFLLLLVLLAVLAAFYLWRQGKLTLPSFATRRSPEDEVKQILADRFPAATSAPTSFWSARASSTGPRQRRHPDRRLRKKRR